MHQGSSSNRGSSSTANEDGESSTCQRDGTDGTRGGDVLKWNNEQQRCHSSVTSNR